MDFANFGRVSFTSEAKVADFVTYLDQGKVMATRCKQCQASYFPPRMDCPGCFASDMEWFEIKGNGKLITYTEVNYGPSGFEDDAPYILALAEFGDLKILGRLSPDIKPDDIKLGMPLKVTAIKLPDDRVSYQFQPA